MKTILISLCTAAAALAADPPASIPLISADINRLSRELEIDGWKPSHSAGYWSWLKSSLLSANAVGFSRVECWGESQDQITLARITAEPSILGNSDPAVWEADVRDYFSRAMDWFFSEPVNLKARNWVKNRAGTHRAVDRLSSVEFRSGAVSDSHREIVLRAVGPDTPAVLNHGILGATRPSIEKSWGKPEKAKDDPDTDIFTVGNYFIAVTFAEGLAVDFYVQSRSEEFTTAEATAVLSRIAGLGWPPLKLATSDAATSSNIDSTAAALFKENEFLDLHISEPHELWSKRQAGIEKRRNRKEASEAARASKIPVPE